MWSVISWRCRSLTRLSERSGCGHSGSLRRKRSSPSPGPERLLAVRLGQSHEPRRLVLVPVRALDGRAEPDVRPHAELLARAHEIVLDLLAWREVAAPAMAAPEGVRVGVVGRVDAAARIAVLEPGAADLRVSLDDHVGDAEPREARPDHDAARTGSDHQHPARCGGLADRLAHVERQTRVLVRDQADVASRPVRRLEPAAVTGEVEHHHQEHRRSACSRAPQPCLVPVARRLGLGSPRHRRAFPPGAVHRGPSSSWRKMRTHSATSSSVRGGCRRIRLVSTAPRIWRATTS